MKYKQLTAADRGAIEILLRRDFTLSQVAEEIGRDKGTISREIKNRATPNGYFADIAQLDYETSKKRSSKNAKKITHSRIRNYILSKLEVGWSPEEITGRMKLEGRDDYICHETIYNFIYTDPYCVENDIYQYLRRGKKKRTKWKGRKAHKSKIPNRVSISKRPEVVEERREFGHWEGDSVIYPKKKAINTVNELMTGLVQFTKLEAKKADLTARAMIKKLSKFECKTVTVDNGSEFTKHEEISAEIGTKVYFCHPYSSWERGANENVNMLLRGYLPKRHNIDKLTQEELDDIAEELNNRPRKRLGYLTPAETYQQLFNLNVAVRSRM
jgi:IS30 family transposase